MTSKDEQLVFCMFVYLNATIYLLTSFVLSFIFWWCSLNVSLLPWKVYLTLYNLEWRNSNPCSRNLFKGHQHLFYSSTKLRCAWLRIHLFAPFLWDVCKRGCPSSDKSLMKGTSINSASLLVTRTPLKPLGCCSLSISWLGKKQTKRMLAKKKKISWKLTCQPNRSKASLTVRMCKYADVITFVDCGLTREGLCVCVNMLCVCVLRVNIDERPVSPDGWVWVSDTATEQLAATQNFASSAKMHLLSTNIPFFIRSFSLHLCPFLGHNSRFFCSFAMTFVSLKNQTFIHE